MSSWDHDLKIFKTNIKEISSNFLSELSQTLKGDEVVMSEVDGITRNQVVAKVLSTVVGIAASFTLTYWGIKWLTDAMDPTKKEKKLAQAEVY